jgi:hypothetical protein
LKRTWKTSLVTAILIAGFCLVLLAILAVLNRRTQVVRLTHEIQYDVFAFSVLRARAATSLAATGLAPGARASPVRMSEGCSVGDILDSIFYGKR